VPALGGTVAVLDACVLVPFYLCDTLLRAAEAGLYQPRWSRDILEEVERALLERLRAAPGRVRRLLAAIRATFPEAQEIGYRGLVESMTNDPGDRHVLALAVHARADVIVTRNLRHFPRSALAPYGLRAVSPDAFLLDLLDRDRSRMVSILFQQASDYHAPPLTPEAIAGRLRELVPRYAAALRSLLVEVPPGMLPPRE
jgi:predicted nucleic acid-binding protein